MYSPGFTLLISLKNVVSFMVDHKDTSWLYALKSKFKSLNGKHNIALIDEENKDILEKAGCPLDKPFVKIEGTVTIPDMSGDISGKLSCKIFFITVASLEFFGTLTAST